jgi:hypothetical protein
MKPRFRTSRFLLVLTLIVAFGALSGAAMANGKMRPAKPAPSYKAPAMPGRGPISVTMTTITASSVGNTAWLYNTWPTSCPPTQVTGTIQAMATKAPADMPSLNDRATIMASFTCMSGGPTYMVAFKSLASAGRFNTPFGGVAFRRTIFGDTRYFNLNLPVTTAYVAVLGLATVTKDGQVIAEDQPAIAALTHAIHDTNQKLLSQADATRNEFHLIMPGSKVQGVSAIPDFPNGYFYVYWPDATYNITTDTISIPAETAAPLGKGPQESIGSLVINLTNKGISKKVGIASSGLYDITVKNISNKPQGLYMTGTDICCTDYKRFSKIIKPGDSQKFRFYFAKGKVVMRPFCCAIKTPTSYKDYNWTGPATSIVFE